MYFHPYYTYSALHSVITIMVFGIPYTSSSLLLLPLPLLLLSSTSTPGRHHHHHQWNMPSTCKISPDAIREDFLRSAMQIFLVVSPPGTKIQVENTHVYIMQTTIYVTKIPPCSFRSPYNTIHYLAFLCAPPENEGKKSCLPLPIIYLSCIWKKRRFSPVWSSSMTESLLSRVEALNLRCFSSCMGSLFFENTPFCKDQGMETIY